MESIPGPLNPAHDLALLERAQQSALDANCRDFGPAWYAPALATLVAAVTLFGDATGLLKPLYGVIAAVSAIALSVHDHRRRKIRSRASRRSFQWLFVAALLGSLLAASWGTALNVIGYEDFVPWYALLGWVLTTGLMLGVRQLLESKRGPRVREPR